MNSRDKPAYLIDASVFIQASHLFYQFDFCKSFWRLMIEGHENGLVFSTTSIRRELLRGHEKDLIIKWMKEELPSGFFLNDENHSAINRNYAFLMNWSQNQTFKQTAINEFADENNADARLIATAKVFDYTLVSQEKNSPDSKKKIYIPVAAKAIGVRTIFIYDMLSELCEKGNDFCLKQNLKI